MNQPQVSVIVPVYNAREYLPRMLDSLLEQTLPAMEVICVDDCSTDGSIDVLRTYAGKYPDLFRLICNEENMGVGLSRNVGIEAARGEFVGFADNDDMTEPEMFEKLYHHAVAGDFDIVRCDVHVHQEPPVEPRLYPARFEDGSPELHDEMLRHLLYTKPADFADRLWPSGVWNKIYSRRLIRKEGLGFLSERELPFEDFLFNLKALLATDKVGRIRGAYYHHYHYTSSLGCSNYQYKCFRHGIKTIEEARVLLNHYHPAAMNVCRERLAYRLWANVPFSLINEWKRNPKGKVAALREVGYILRHPLVAESVKYIDLKEVNLEPGFTGRFQKMVYHIVKCINGTC